MTLNETPGRISTGLQQVRSSQRQVSLASVVLYPCPCCSAAPTFASNSFQECNTLRVKSAWAGVAQGSQCWPANQRVGSSIPSQDTCSSCGPGPWWEVHKGQPHIDVSVPLFLPLSLKINLVLRKVKLEAKYLMSPLRNSLRMATTAIKSHTGALVSHTVPDSPGVCGPLTTRRYEIIRDALLLKYLDFLY